MTKDKEVMEEERGRGQDRRVLNCVLQIENNPLFSSFPLRESPDWPLNELMRKGRSVW